MLTRLYATNYRCLVNFEFKPTSKQLIIGRNGVGKSTVLDILSMIRDFAVRGLPREGYLLEKTRTIWQDIAEQHFELDVTGNRGDYRYKLIVDEAGSPSRTRVKLETLEFNSKLLFRFQDGQIGLFSDQQKPKPSVEFPFDWHRSGLATVEVGRKDNTKLSWFKRWLDGLVHVQINPWAMSARSERESHYLLQDLSNFADWYRHLRLDRGNDIFEAMVSLREAIPGLEALDAKEAGLDVRILQASLRNPNGRGHEALPFTALSEGQRALIALYVLLHCAIGEDSLLLIDEPDNFIALAEIQPWLVRLLDRVDERNGQVIVVSHHPELLDQLASQGGVLLERSNGAETRIVPFTPDDSGLKPSEIIARGWERAGSDS